MTLEAKILAEALEGPVFWRGEAPPPSELYAVVPTDLGLVVTLSPRGSRLLGLNNRRTPGAAGLARKAFARFMQELAEGSGWKLVQRGPRHVLERPGQRLVVLFLPSGIQGAARRVLKEARGDPRPHLRIVLAPRGRPAAGEVWLPLEPRSLDDLQRYAELAG